MRAWVRVCSCVFVSVSVYIGGGVGAEVCVFILAKSGDCDVSIPVVVGNSILNQLILVMMMLEYRVLLDSCTNPANLVAGDDG